MRFYNGEHDKVEQMINLCLTAFVLKSAIVEKTSCKVEYKGSSI
jgi:hypothetical protein